MKQQKVKQEYQQIMQSTLSSELDKCTWWELTWWLRKTACGGNLDIHLIYLTQTGNADLEAFMIKTSF